MIIINFGILIKSISDCIYKLPGTQTFMLKTKPRYSKSKRQLKIVFNLLFWGLQISLIRQELFMLTCDCFRYIENCQAYKPSMSNTRYTKCKHSLHLYIWTTVYILLKRGFPGFLKQKYIRSQFSLMVRFKCLHAPHKK